MESAQELREKQLFAWVSEGWLSKREATYAISRGVTLSNVEWEKATDCIADRKAGDAIEKAKEGTT